jgi:TolB protein
MSFKHFTAVLLFSLIVTACSTPAAATSAPTSQPAALDQDSGTPPPAATIESTNAPALVSDGSIVFTTDRDGDYEIYQMQADGSDQHVLFSDPDMEDEFPQLSADGSYLLMFSWDPNAEISPYIARVLSPEGLVTLGEFTGGNWAPTGTHLVVEYTSEGKEDIDLAIMDLNDPNTLTPLVTDPSNDWNPDWCGDQILFSSDRTGTNQLFVINTDGNGLRMIETGGVEAFYGAWSPDCSKIAYLSSPDIYIVDVAGGEPTQLTSRIGYTEDPAWSPDGTQIAFVSDTGGNFEIYVVSADGGNPVNISNSPGLDMYPSWVP